MVKNDIVNFLDKIQNQEIINVLDVIKFKKSFSQSPEENIIYIKERINHILKDENFNQYKTYFELNAILEMISINDRVLKDNPIFNLFDKFKETTEKIIYNSKLGLKSFQLNLKNSLNIEYIETIDMFKYLWDKKIDEERKKETVKQIKDLEKIIVAASTPAVALPLLEYSIKKITKDPNSTILPTSFKPSLKKLKQLENEFDKFEEKWNKKLENGMLSNNEINKMLFEYQILENNVIYSVGKEYFKEFLSDKIIHKADFKDILKHFDKNTQEIDYESITL